MRERFAARGIELHAISGATGDGTRQLMQLLMRSVHAARATLEAAPPGVTP